MPNIGSLIGKFKHHLTSYLPKKQDSREARRKRPDAIVETKVENSLAIGSLEANGGQQPTRTIRNGPFSSTIPVKTQPLVTVRNTMKGEEWHHKINDEPSHISATTSQPGNYGVTLSQSSNNETSSYLKWYKMIQEQDNRVTRRSSLARQGRERNVEIMNERTGIHYFLPVYENLIVSCKNTQERYSVRQPCIEKHKQTAIKGKYKVTNCRNDLGKRKQTNDKMLARKYNASIKCTPYTSTRAQRLRDGFIKQKINRINTDEADGWWKNFNSRIYAEDSEVLKGLLSK